MASSTVTYDNQQPNSTRCVCKGVCSRKDGSKRKGCPCKTQASFCRTDCECGSRNKPCQNKAEYIRPAREKRTRTENQHTDTQRDSEFIECDREHGAVKNFITNLEERTLRALCIRVLSRGIGSMDFIQSQLVGVEDEESQPIFNIYGSPIRSIELRDDGSRHTRTPPPLSQPHTPSEMSFITCTKQTPAAVDRNTPISPDLIYTSPPDTNSTNTEIPVYNPLPDLTPIFAEQSPSDTAQQRHAVPDWCKCGHCREMPKLVENVCCRVKKCVAESIRFYKLCLDPDVLSVAVLNHADIRNDPFDNSTRQFRKAAYRQFILDKYGHLGRGNRRVVPSCIVWKVRNKYPSPTGIYMG